MISLIATLLLLINPFFWVALFFLFNGTRRITKNIYFVAAVVAIQLFSYPFLEILLETKNHPHLSLHESLLGALFVGILTLFFLREKKKTRRTLLTDFFIDI